MTYTARLRANHTATWAATLWGLNATDLLLTRLIIRNGGLESNPLLGGWIDLWWGGIIKLLIPGLLLLFLVKHQERRIVREGLPVVTLLYLLVVLWNVSVVLTQYTRIALT